MISKTPINIIKNKALSIGFDTVSITSPHLADSAKAGLDAFIAAGYHGDMQWMADKADKRADPKAIWPEVKSIIVLGHNYGSETNPMEKLALRNQGNISAYALNQDYH